MNSSKHPDLIFEEYSNILSVYLLVLKVFIINGETLWINKNVKGEILIQRCHFIFLKVFFNHLLSVLSACKSLYHMDAWYPVEDRIRLKVPWVWNYKWLWTIMWILENEHSSYGRAASDINYWVISPCPAFHLNHEELSRYHRKENERYFKTYIYIYMDIYLYIHICSCVYMYIFNFIFIYI